MNWLLIVVLAILVINSLIGMKVGMIKTIFSLCSMVVALLLTMWLSPYVNDFLRGNEKFCNKINTGIEKVLPLSEKKTNHSEQVSAIEKLKLPKSLKNSLIENNNVDSYKNLAVKGFKDYVSSYLTGIVINALAFSLTFIIILILLWGISIALDLIGRLPLLKQVNKTAGLIAGFVQGLVIVWVFFVVLTIFQSSELGRKAMEMIGNDQILSFIYNNNYLLKFISGATKILL